MDRAWPEASGGVTMDPLSLLLGDDPSQAADARALAEAMRRRGQFGTLLQMSGDKALAPAGQFIARDATGQIEAAAQAAQQRQAAQARAAQQSAAQAQWERQFGESSRHNRAMEARAQPPPYVIVQGEGGGQFYSDPRNPTKPAIPVTGPDGQPIMKPPRNAGKPVPQWAATQLKEIAGEVNSLDTLSSRFKDDYAGGGPGGALATSIYAKLGSAGSKGMQEQASFWSDYEKMINLPERNKVFGASLSEGEKAAWDAARNIRPGVAPELVRQKLAELRGIYQANMQRIAAGLEADGFNAEAIGSYAGGKLGEAQAPSAPAGGTVRKFTRGADGKLVEVK